MKKAIPYLYLFMPTAIALASGNEADGHSHEVADVADPSKRIYVMVGVGVVFVAMVAWFIWSKRKAN